MDAPSRDMSDDEGWANTKEFIMKIMRETDPIAPATAAEDIPARFEKMIANCYEILADLLDWYRVEGNCAKSIFTCLTEEVRIYKRSAIISFGFCPVQSFLTGKMAHCQKVTCFINFNSRQKVAAIVQLQLTEPKGAIDELFAYDDWTDKGSRPLKFIGHLDPTPS